MSNSMRAAFILIVVSVLANNYVYLHDVIWSRNPELNAAANDLLPDVFGSLIFIGWVSYLGIISTLGFTVLGLIFVWRALGEAEAS